jgi:hypothetical protein
VAIRPCQYVSGTGRQQSVSDSGDRAALPLPINESDVLAGVTAASWNGLLEFRAIPAGEPLRRGCILDRFGRDSLQVQLSVLALSGYDCGFDEYLLLQPKSNKDNHDKVSNKTEWDQD